MNCLRMMVILMGCTFSILAMAESKVGGAADSDWKALEIGKPPPHRMMGESAFEHYVRSVELNDRRRREEGLRFWNEHPDDARRYRWLIQTVHMPPHYPVDIQEWARAECKAGPNLTAVDERALRTWRTVYSNLREQFDTATEVSAQQRRFLRYGEMFSELADVRARRSRGQTIDSIDVLEGIASYATDFPSPLAEADGGEFYACLEILFYYTVRFREELGIDEEHVRQLAQRLMRSGNKVAARIAERYTKRKNNLEVPILPMALRKIPQYKLLAEPRDRSWRWLLMNCNYAQDQPSTVDGMLIFHHHNNIATRKLREIGQQLWQDSPDPTFQRQWLFTTLNYGCVYLDNPAKGIYAMQRGERRATNDGMDEAALNDWLMKIPELTASLEAAALLSDSEKYSIECDRLQDQLDAAETALVRRDDKACMSSAIREVLRLALGGPDPKSFLPVVYDLVRSYPHYGLSNIELTEVLQKLLKSPSSEIRQLAKGRLGIEGLRTTPLRLSAPTLSGELFDIASFRGKIVLVDFWTTTCSPCIESMPAIHRVYEKYRAKGFEVVSVCLDANERRAQVERNEREAKLTWTTLVGDSLRGELADKYAITSVPQYMLLATDGTLIAGTAEIDAGRNLESLLIDFLSREKGEVSKRSKVSGEI